jgi:hypothetical protein
MDTGTVGSSSSSAGVPQRWKRWKIFAVVASFTVVRLFLVDRHNSAKVAFVEAYEAKDASAAWQALDRAERGTWSWLPFLGHSRGSSAAIIRTELRNVEGSSSVADLLRSAQMPGIPSWAVRRNRWLGFGDPEWTVAERTFFGGSTEVVYRVSGGRAVEQPSGN